MVQISFTIISKSIVVGTMAVVLATVGIMASDTLQGVSGSLLGQVVGTDQGGQRSCPPDMIATPMLTSIRCVDTFEAAPAADCPYPDVRRADETRANLAKRSCVPVTLAERSPWTYVTREEARQLCVRAGKRLATAAEWYQLAIGATAYDCNTDTGGVAKSGSHTACQSALGVYDTVGNVWEWVSEDVLDGQYAGRQLPNAGYVAAVAVDGMPTETSASPTMEEFGADFFWSEATGAFGLLRGGFYGSGDDAGVYATQAKIKPTLSTQAIGFRCVL